MYNGVRLLNEEHTRKFEHCVKIKSTRCMQDLAKEIFDSAIYSVTLEQNLVNAIDTVFYDYAGNSSSYIAAAFAFEYSIQKAKKEFKEDEEALKARGFTLGLQSAVDKKDAKALVSASEECLAKPPNDGDECAHHLDKLELLYSGQRHLETIEIKCNGTSTDTFTRILSDIIDPAIILINAQTYLKVMDDEALITKLKHYHIGSYEEAIKISKSLNI